MRDGKYSASVMVLTGLPRAEFAEVLRTRPITLSAVDATLPFGSSPRANTASRARSLILASLK